MKSACIITDGFAQTTQAVFPGRNLVRTLPVQVAAITPLEDQSNSTITDGISSRLTSRLVYPSEESISELLCRSALEFDEILVIITSSSLSPLYGIVEETVNTSPVSSRIKLIDSMSISIGLGYLVEKSAHLLVAQKNVGQVEETIRSIIHHIYSIFSIPNLTNLYLSGFLDDAQAMVGEILGIYPLFTLEEGRLTPLQKVKNSRAALDYFQEFIDEFDNLDHIAVTYGNSIANQELRPLKQYCDERFSHPSFSEHPLNAPLTALLGSKCAALFSVENLPRLKRG